MGRGDLLNMSFASLYKLPVQAVSIHRKILNESEVRTVQSAQELIEKCRQQCTEIMDRVDADREAELGRGYQEGREAGLRSCGELLIEIEAKNAAYWDSHAQHVTMLVHAVLDRVVGKMSPQELVADMASEVIKQMTQERRVVVKVHANCVEHLKKSLFKLKGDLPWMEQIEVLAEPSFNMHDCLIETPNGYVNAGWDVQMRAIQSTLAALAVEWVPPPMPATKT
jgi:flagellar assembly protein FliH